MAPSKGIIEGITARARAATPSALLPGEEEAAFIRRLAETLHGFGIAAHRMEEALARVAEAVELEAEFLVTPTFIIISVGPQDHSQVYLARVGADHLDLTNLTRLHRLIRDLVDGSLSLQEASRELDEIRAPRPRTGPLTTVLGSGVAAGSAALILEGGVAEAWTAAGLGVTLGLMLKVGHQFPAFRPTLPLAAGFVTAFGAGIMGAMVGPISTYIPALASLLVLLPGQSLTVSMNELAHRHLISGGARLMGVLIVLLQLGFGFALGQELAGAIGGSSELALPEAASPWILAMALLANMVAFGVRANARPADFPTLVLAAGVGLAFSKLATVQLGPELGICLSAWVVGTLGNLISRWQDIPSQTAILPGLVLLLPGSLGFSSMSALIAKDIVAGLETGVTMVLIAFSLVTGLLLANLTSRPKELF